MGESIQPNMDGQGWATYHLIQNLSKIKNIDLTVIGDGYLNKIDIKTKKLIHKKKKTTVDKILYFDILKKVNAEKYDIIHSPVNYGLPYFWFVNALKVKTIHDATGFEVKCNYSLVHKMQLKSQFELFGNRIDKIATVSNTSKNEIVKHFHFQPEKIQVIYNGVCKEFRVIEKEVCKKILNKYNIKKPFIFHISKASSVKNIDGIIKAFQKIKNKVNCDLVIGGAWKGHTTERIISAGYIPFKDLPYLYSGSEIFVFPSFHEGFGLPILEAMACGTPVITSNVYATKEIASDAAICLNPYDNNEIAEAMLNLLNDKNRKEELIKKGLKRIQQFTWEKCAKKYIELYKNLLDTQKKSDEQR